MCPPIFDVTTLSVGYLRLLNLFLFLFFLRFLGNWIYRGQCCDPFQEFLISINSEFLEKRDRSYWTDGFALDEIHREQGPFVNSSIDDDAIHGLYTDIYICGKTVNLLKLCHGKV